MRATITGLGIGGRKIPIEVPEEMPVVFDFHGFKVFLSKEGAVMILPPETAENVAQGVENGRSRFLFSYRTGRYPEFKALDAAARKFVPEDV